IAHHALRANNRPLLKVFLGLTWLLGFIFVYLQATEYIHAYQDLGLTLGTGIYGAAFSMLTSFHGLHVPIAAPMLFGSCGCVMRGHASPVRHLAFEAVAERWHSGDRVWLVRLVFVCWIPPPARRRRRGRRAGGAGSGATGGAAP